MAEPRSAGREASGGGANDPMAGKKRSGEDGPLAALKPFEDAYTQYWRATEAAIANAREPSSLQRLRHAPKQSLGSGDQFRAQEAYLTYMKDVGELGLAL